MGSQRKKRIKHEIEHVYDRIILTLDELKELRDRFNQLDAAFGEVMDTIDEEFRTDDGIQYEKVPPSLLEELLRIRWEVNRIYDDLLTLTYSLTGNADDEEMSSGLRFLQRVVSQNKGDRALRKECKSVIDLYTESVRPLITNFFDELNEASGFIEQFIFEAR